jgi:hypothetical protein
MDFTKIKVSKGRVYLEYVERLKDDKIITHSIEAPDDALLSFSQSIKALKKDFLDILELDSLSPELLERVSIHTITLHYKDADRSIIISANIATTMTSGSYNVNSPLRELDASDSTQLVGLDTVKKIEKVLKEAQKFLDGDRLQGNLFIVDKKAANE